MAMTLGFTAVTGATYTAAQYNTNVRDNWAASWVYSVAGDLMYATGATTATRLAIGAAQTLLKSTGAAPAWSTLAALMQLTALVSGQAAGDLFYANAGTTIARLPKGTAYQTLRMNGGATAPAWASVLAYCEVSRSSVFAVQTDTVINWNSEIYDDPGWHSPVTNPERITPGVAGTYMAFAHIHVVAADLCKAMIKLNNTTLLGAARVPGGGYEAFLSPHSRAIEMSNTDYVNVVVDDNGVSANMSTDSWFQLVRIQ